MGLTNTILVFSGIIVTLIGIGAWFNPNLARFINAPGNPQVKGLIAAIIGIILLIIGLAFQFQY